MDSIERLEVVEHPELQGVRIFPLSAQRLRRGVTQDVLVEVVSNGCIPLHDHSVDAEMYIVAGGGTVLSSNPDLNGKPVGPGTAVIFRRNVAHGFVAGPQGLSFVSRNGGIVDVDNDNWDLRFQS